MSDPDSSFAASGKILPQPVVQALKALAAIERQGGQTPDDLAALKKGLPVLAMKLAQRGDAVSADILAAHAGKGPVHIRDLCQSFNKAAGFYQKAQGMRVSELRHQLERKAGKRNAAAQEKKEDPARAARIRVLQRVIGMNDVEALAAVMQETKPALSEKEGHELFAAAVDGGSGACLRLLVERGHVPDPGKFEEIADDGLCSQDIEVVRVVLDLGPAPQALNDAMIKAVKNDRLDIFRVLLERQGTLALSRKQPIALANALLKRGWVAELERVAARGLDLKKYARAALKTVPYKEMIRALPLWKKEGVDLSRVVDYMTAALFFGSPDDVRFLAAGGSRFRFFSHYNAMMGHLRVENVKALLDCQPRRNPKLEKDLMRTACDMQHLECMHFLARRGVSLDCGVVYGHGGINTPERLYKAHSANLDLWDKLHGGAPDGLGLFDPRMHNPVEFAKVRAEALTETPNSRFLEIRDVNVSSFYAVRIFGTCARAVEYFRKHALSEDGVGWLVGMFHRTCGASKVPQGGNPDMKAWGDAALELGPALLNLVEYADRLPCPGRSADGKGWSLEKTRGMIAQLKFNGGTRHPEIARLTSRAGRGQEVFNKAVRLVEEHRRLAAVNDNSPKPNAHVPDIRIDGKNFGMKGYSFFKLPSGDVRSLFLGDMTACCQRLGGTGEAAVRSGFLSPDSGFYAVMNDRTGEVVGQTWAWRGSKGELVFDSLETLGKRVRPRNWRAICTELGRFFAENKSDVTALYVGTEGNTPRFRIEKAKTPAVAQKKLPYTDAVSQYSFWKR